MTRVRAGRSGVRFPTEGRDLCRLQFVPTDAGAQRDSYPMSNSGKASGGVKISTHLRLVPRLRMSGAVPIPPSPVCRHMCKGTAVPSLAIINVATLRIFELNWSSSFAVP